MADRDAALEESTLALEQALVGALLSDRDAVAAVVERLRPEAFAFDGPRRAYGAICRLWHRRTPTDLLTIVPELEGNPTIADLAEWQTECFRLGWTVHAGYYADAIVRAAKRRAVIRAGADLVARAHADPDADPAALFHDALAGLDAVGAGPDGGPVPYAELVADYQERIDRMRAGDLTVNATPTGFRLLDYRLRGGLLPGELVILAARPSMGKTAFALQVAHNAARTGNRVVVFSAEMGTDALMERAAAEVGNVSPGMVESGALPDGRWNAFLEAVDRLRRLPIEVDATSGITTDAMMVRVQRAQAHGPVKLVVFDYLELAGDRVNGDSEERRVAAISRRMKHLARVCDVPVLLLCQLNRAVEARREKVPTLADLRYSGAIEQDADKVLFIYRHDYYVVAGTATEDPAKVGTADVIVAKHRSGGTGTTTLRFDASTMSFREMDQ